MNALLMTTDKRRILVPRTLVAEVIGTSLLEFVTDAVTGLAVFSWRGRRVPLLRSSELGGLPAAAGEDDDAPGESKVAVFHGLKQQLRLPFYGVMVARSPRLLRLDEGDLDEVVGVQLLPGELMRVRVDGGEASIPKVDQLESSLIDLMKQLPAG